jgi:hypothetical protein
MTKRSNDDDDARARKARADAIRQARDQRNAALHRPPGAPGPDDVPDALPGAAPDELPDESPGTSDAPDHSPPAAPPNFVDLIDQTMRRPHKRAD